MARAKEAPPRADGFIPVRDRPGGWRRELLGVLGAIAIVLIGFHGVAFQGKTMDTSSYTTGVNGYQPPTGVARPTINGFRVDPGASSWQMLPWAYLTAHEISAREVPTWDPYAGAGTPLAANGQSAVFDPLMVVMDLHPTVFVWDMSFLFAFILAAVAMYLFLRNLGMGMLAALAGTTAFSLGGVWVVMGNNSFVRGYVYLPILFGLVDQLVRSAKLRWVGSLGVAVAAAVLVGMPEVILFVVGAAALYALFRLLWPPNGLAAVGRWLRAARLAGAALLGLALAAPLLVLMAGYLPSAYNSHTSAVGGLNAPFGTLLNWVIPFVNDYPAQLRLAQTTDRTWLGAAGAVLVVVAIAAPKGMRRFAGWFFAAVAALILLKIHGVPVIQLAGKLPVLNEVNFETFAAPTASFCLAGLVAIGVEGLVRGELVRRRLLIGLGVLAVLVGVFAGADRHVLTELFRQSLGMKLPLALAAGAAGAVALAAVGAVWLPKFRSPLAAAAVAVLFVELFTLFGPGSFPPRADPYQAPPWMAAVTSGLRADPEARVFGLDRVLEPDTAGVFGIEDPRTLDALFVKRYRTFIRDFVTPSYTDRFTGDTMQPQEVAGNPMFDLLGVKYVLTGPTPGTAATQLSPGQYSLVESAGGISVYQNNDVLPRAFVATDVHSVGGEQQAVSYLQSLGSRGANGATIVSGFDPTAQAVVEGGSSSAGVTGTARPVSIASYSADDVRIAVAPGSPGLLVLTDTYMPGWQATVNGKPAPVLPTDVAFRGVSVGPGASVVEFRYRPPHEALAWWLPVVGLVVFAGVWLALRLTRGRTGLLSDAPGRVVSSELSQASGKVE